MKQTLAILLLTLAPSVVLSQSFSQNRGPAEEYYKSRSQFDFEFESKKTGGPVRWTAATQQIVKDEYALLEGDVKLYYQDVVISADRITYNLKTRDVVAEGRVVIDQATKRMSANRIVFNLESRTGTLFEARAAFEPSVYFTGEKIEKIDEDTYRLTNGVFTSCDVDSPSWSFHLAEGEITVDDYARLRNVSFRARKVPMFWTPYIVWPTKRDRSKGFLIPKPGYSNQYGAFLRTQYFVPIGQSVDATVTAEGYSKGVFAAGLETRYAPKTGTKGRFDGYTVSEDSRDGLEWKYVYQHTQESLPGGFRGVIDIQNFSDLQFFQQFEREFELNTISSIHSSAYLTKNAPSHSLNLRLDRQEHFLGPEEQRIFEQLPSVELRSYPNRIGNTPIYFSLESSASHLRTTPGTAYFRLDAAPTFTLQMKTPPWLAIKPQLSLRETYYTATVDPSTQEIVDEGLSRFYGQGQVEIVGPSFSRVFDRPIRSFAKFKHVIEPRVKYIYTSNVEDRDKVVRFDTVDSPSLPLVRDLVEYSLVQRLLAKEKTPDGSAREILSLTLRQSVSLSEPYQQTVATEKYSPLVLSLHANPYQSVNMDGSLTWGVNSHQLDQSSLSASLRGKTSYLSFTWFATYAAPGATSADSSQLRIATGFPFATERFRFDTQVNYDATRSTILEQRHIAGLFASCYTISLEYRDFLQNQGAEGPTRRQDYLLSISLKNVGTFVDLKGSLDTLF